MYFIAKIIFPVLAESEIYNNNKYLPNLIHFLNFRINSIKYTFKNNFTFILYCLIYFSFYIALNYNIIYRYIVYIYTYKLTYYYKKLINTDNSIMLFIIINKN